MYVNGRSGSIKYNVNSYNNNQINNIDHNVKKMSVPRFQSFSKLINESRRNIQLKNPKRNISPVEHSQDNRSPAENPKQNLSRYFKLNEQQRTTLDSLNTIKE